MGLGGKLKQGSKTVRSAGSRAKRVVLRAARARIQDVPIDRDVVLFESYGGNTLGCSPEQIFRVLAADVRYSHLKFVWSLQEPEQHTAAVAALREVRDFDVVRRGSAEYLRAVASAGYLVNNMSFPQDFTKRPGQVYLNTWHGVPLKRMGYDVVGHVEDGRNIVRNFLAADYLLSSSRAMTERMYLGAFKLTNVFEGRILEEGSPRTDRQVDRAVARAEMERWMPQLAGDSRRVVLYAPTWRGADYAKPEAEAASLAAALEAIKAAVDPGTTRVLLKAHQVIATQIAGMEEFADVLVPSEVQANTALGVAEVLVTDYSSIFYDFLATGRPVIHYAPDLQEYAQYRDVYDAPETWPGEVTVTPAELTDAVASALRPGWAPSERYLEALARWAPLDDGAVTPRVIDAVFGGRSASYRGLNAPSDGRTKILMYAGAFIPNGITTSAKNLLRTIDHGRYDVTVLVPYSAKDPARREGWNGVDPRTRLLFRAGPFAGGLGAALWRAVDLHTPLPVPHAFEDIEDQAWETEFRRLFGAARFHHVIDFSGYSPLWGRLLRVPLTRTRSVWMHNDLFSDAQRTVNGRQPLKRGLEGVFRQYKYFDSLVSVSEQLADINREHLAAAAPAARFTWVPNTVDAERIVRLGAEPDPAGYPAGVRRFVAVGRLSPEKNHRRLIRAFAEAAAESPEARLDILGDGPLRSELGELITDLGMGERITLRGHVSNPHAWVAHSDAMLVSSDYEGQPMVILEALTLGKPVISTRFGSVNSAFPEGGGVVVDATVSALAEATAAARVRRPGAPPFDVNKYPAGALRRLDEVLGEAPEAPRAASANDKEGRA